ncbi:Tc toxin subunit A-related protein, partial [Frankia sp. CiP1_Cm_nod2]|uniref:Tc toxin subunit A-related protein n=1 Tax=Frankia sp. CiP1_Cm_nod2 TaxID=2897161 RepID=UPI0020248FB7
MSLASRFAVSDIVTSGVFGTIGKLSLPSVTVGAFYHPFLPTLIQALAVGGVEGMLARSLQVAPWNFQPWPDTGRRFDFRTAYNPSPLYVRQPHPAEDLDFSPAGAYSSYNWDLFFHAVRLVAARLRSNGQFDAGLRWLRTIFDPSCAAMVPGDAPDPVRSRWQTRPFYERARADYRQQRIESLLANTADPAFQLQVARWREHPFDPHAVASLRTVAYQKAVFMDYLDLLLDAGDRHFAAGTSEELNLAYGYYAYAQDMLGPAQPQLPPHDAPPAHTYRTLGATFGGFSNALVAAEHLVTVPDGVREAGPPVPATVLSLATVPYFCVPRNDRLAGYWDIVDDRLHKLRNSLDLQGNPRVTDLWGRQLDPARIARLLAAGMSLDEALAELSAPPPRHRFHTLLARALDLAQEARQLGQALLTALEKRDAEQLAVLRATHETQLLERMTAIRDQHLKAAQLDEDAAAAAHHAAGLRHRHYLALLVEWERDQGPASDNQKQLDKITSATDWNIVSTSIQATTSLLNAIPQAKFGPWIFGAEHGGQQLAAVVNTAAVLAQIKASIDHSEGTKAGLRADHEWRRQDWEFQRDLAAADMDHLFTLAGAAAVRKAAAQREHDNSVEQLTESRAVLDLMTSKFTSADLFSWQARELTAMYRELYNLAFRLARQAERAWQQELYRYDRTFVRAGVWDSERKGLLAADRLVADLRTMDAACLDHDDRLHEVTRPVSLRLLDPAALADLVTHGTATFVLPEWLFDLDFPGHYQRRIRTVALTIPCITGPYTSVNARLTLDADRIRRSADPASGANGDAYAPTGDDDNRFEPSGRAGGSIVTSHGQNDQGLFDGGQNDDRLLPFENAGLISRWTLRLPKDSNSFDTSTVSDVIMTIRYTARYDDRLARAAREHVDTLLARPPAADTAAAAARPAPRP